MRGLNRNHSLRVWCECLDNPLHEPGSIPTGLYWRDRPLAAVKADPRRLWSYDDIGVVDVRVPGSALDLFRRHVEAHERELQTTTREEAAG